MTSPAIVLSDHARVQITLRQLSMRDVLLAILQPESTLTVRPGREIRQREHFDAVSGKMYVLRVIVDQTPDEVTVVTAYKTSRTRKYGAPR